MSERFIKLKDSEEADYLQEYHPNAFLLLCYIAKRARRLPNHPDGLEIGEAFIGDYKKAGIETEMKYRTAKKVLQQRQHLKICETCRNRKNATTGTTTVGTKVRILRSDVCDINSKPDNDRNNDRITTEQRPDNDEQERTRKNKNVKNSKPHTPFRSLDDSRPAEPVSGSVPVFYDCLMFAELTNEEKQSLFRFPEERVKLALEFAKTNPPKKSLIALLKWHCGQPNPPIAKGQFVEQNREIAKKYLEKHKEFVVGVFKRQGDYLVVGPSLETSTRISYNENPGIFEQQLESALRKHEFWKAG